MMPVVLKFPGKPAERKPAGNFSLRPLISGSLDRKRVRWLDAGTAI
jgi:hypothetical protein